MLHIKHIVCATDFSKCAAVAVDHAVDLARLLRASVTLVHVLPDLPHLFPVFGPGLPGGLLEVLESARSQARKALRDIQGSIEGVTVNTALRDGNACWCILETAAGEKADLIVLGTHGRTGVKHVVLGSVAERIVRSSPVPVLTVRSPD